LILIWAKSAQYCGLRTLLLSLANGGGAFGGVISIKTPEKDKRMMFSGMNCMRFWAIGLIAFLIAVLGCSAPKQVQSIPESISQASLSIAEQALGIEIQSLRLSAEGYMLDFRYEALDPVKAEILFSRKIEPYLLHEATGKVVSVPNTAKVGPLRQTTNKPEAGRSYFMMFANPGIFIHSGDTVTLIFGDHRIEHLTIE
jgi:hypothetical protein